MTRYHTDGVEKAPPGSGFAVEGMQDTDNRVNVVYRCRKAERL
jgi:hypothetical protein